MGARWISTVLFFFGILSLGSTLNENGENVITKTRLVRVSDEYASDWRREWRCEDDFPSETCTRIRNGYIDIDDVSVLRTGLTCAAGWTTASPFDPGCTTACMAGWFGEDCAFQCRCLNGYGDCDRTDGSCNCFDGWKGHECTTRCDLGEYGPNCATAANTCMNRGINHPKTGECLCPHGYRGDRCQEMGNPVEDPSYHFNCEKCSSPGADYCETVINVCSCLPSWTGTYCTEPCEAGTYGLFCEDQCCSGRGHCDVENTRCVCLDGFTGSDCSETCRDGYHGRGCREECPCPSCDHLTGTCDICPPGYRGDTCTKKCGAGKWGSSCNESCTCPSHGTCDVFTGRCLGEDVTTVRISTLAMTTPSAIDLGSPTTNKPDDDRTIIFLVGLTAITLLAVAVALATSWCYCRHRCEKRRRTHHGVSPPPNRAPCESKVEDAGAGHDNGSLYRYDLPPQNEYQELQRGPQGQVVNTIAYPGNNNQGVSYLVPGGSNSSGQRGELIMPVDRVGYCTVVEGHNNAR